MLFKKHEESKVEQLNLPCEIGFESAESRKSILKAFIGLKRLVRTLISETIPYRDTRDRLRRQKALLKAQNIPFNDHRIEKIEEELDDTRGALKAINHSMAMLGWVLYDLCKNADNFLSEHDHAQILGINHVAYKKLRESWASEIKEDAGLYSLISASHGEYRGNADFIGSDEMNQMPLFTVHYHHFLELLDNNSEFKNRVFQGFDEFFPGMPKYRRIEYSDGSSELERITPELKVIEGGRKLKGITIENE